MITPNDFASLLNPLWIFLMLAVLVGSFFAVRNGRQTSLTKFQEATNTALNERIKVLENRIIDLEKENIRQEHVIDTITSALRKSGLVISVDGEVYPILVEKPESGTRRKRITPTPQVGTLTEKKDSI
jgi:uncharacterized coiled-coil protein SlyX